MDYGRGVGFWNGVYQISEDGKTGVANWGVVVVKVREDVENAG